uniref:Wntless-like transmembrane domain-containing protein n=1 Tax=Arcella intermedia TaxID=1963864 RepID=A0A6B2L3X8_9EUKA
MLLCSVILGYTGPQMDEVHRVSAYDCPDGGHFVPCAGSVNVGQEWLRRVTLDTRQLNKNWRLYLTPYTTVNGSGIEGHIKIFTLIEGKQYSGSWSTDYNASETTHLICPSGKECGRFLWVYEETIKYDVYAISLRFMTAGGEDLMGLADVVLEFYKDNPEFSKMALILKVLFLGISIALFAFHYLRLKGSHTTWSNWTDEQKMFIFLIVTLIGLNNPFYPLEFISKNWFIIFMGSFLQILFSCNLFIFWFLTVQKLRSKDSMITITAFLKIVIGFIVLYGILSSTFYIMTNVTDQVPLRGGSLEGHTRNVFLASAAFYITIIALFFATLLVTLQPTFLQVGSRAKLAFFAVPTIVVIISLLVGIFMGVIGDFGHSAPSFVYFLVLYNTYVYYQLWGYWPVELTLGGNNALSENETTQIFIAATQPTYQ